MMGFSRISVVQFFGLVFEIYRFSGIGHSHVSGRWRGFLERSCGLPAYGFQLRFCGRTCGCLNLIRSFQRHLLLRAYFLHFSSA